MRTEDTDASSRPRPARDRGARTSIRTARRSRTPSRSPAAVAASRSFAAATGSAGIDAVIDKDRASALLARGLEAERLLDPDGSTRGLPALRRARSGRDPRTVGRMKPRRLLPQLAGRLDAPEGRGARSRFGGETLITSIDALETALAGNAGTRIRAVGFAAGNGRRRRQTQRALVHPRRGLEPRRAARGARPRGRAQAPSTGRARSTTCCPVARSG